MVTGLYPSSNLWCPHHTARGHKPYRGGVPTAGDTSHVARAFTGPSLGFSSILNADPNAGGEPEQGSFAISSQIQPEKQGREPG